MTVVREAALEASGAATWVPAAAHGALPILNVCSANQYYSDERLQSKRPYTNGGD